MFFFIIIIIAGWNLCSCPWFRFNMKRDQLFECFKICLNIPFWLATGPEWH